MSRDSGRIGAGESQADTDYTDMNALIFFRAREYHNMILWARVAGV